MKKTKLRSIVSIFTLWLLLLTNLSGCSAPESSKDAAVFRASAPQSEENGTAEELTVHFLDIGQGDCIVITQGEHAMMIDAGENDKGTAVQSYLQYLGIDSLDYVILTHPDSDHIGGADVIIYKFSCGAILMPEKETDTRTYDDVLQAMKSKDYTAVHPQPGDTYAFGDASFTILSPERTYSDNNNNSLVVRLTHGENTFLFTGDAELEAEADMLSGGRDLSADVLKVGHHGSSSSTSDDFLAAVSPSCAVISCGEDNKYGHPHAETMNKLRQSGVTVYRTDEQGTITAASDGSSLTWNTSPSDSWLSGEPTGQSPADSTGQAAYILNTSSMKFHRPDCSSVEDMSPSNREDSSLSREELMEQGYEPCGRCKP